VRRKIITEIRTSSSSKQKYNYNIQEKYIEKDKLQLDKNAAEDWKKVRAKKEKAMLYLT